MTPDHPERPDGEEPNLSALFGELFGDASLADNPQLRAALEQMGVSSLPQEQQRMMARQLQSMFSGPGPDGPVDIALTTDVARKVALADADASVSDAARRETIDAAHVASMWLDAVTDLDAPTAPPAAWSRAEWIEATMPSWVDLVGPVADGVTGALTSAMRTQMEQLPEGLVLLAGIDPTSAMAQMGPILHKAATSMMAAQVGQAVGTLSGEIVSGTEVGLPLLPEHHVVLLPAAVTALAGGLDIDTTQVRLYLAARESARCRLFHGAGWLTSALETAVVTYARDIRIDVDAIARRVADAGLDTSDPAALQEALGSDLFTPEPSPAQQRALDHLETLLALTEGWVDVVADAAARPHLPATAALGEAVRRRRATGGPAEHLFAQLVGLELRPRRLREAAALFAALERAGGASLRDSVWRHPDVAPSAADLDDPEGFASRAQGGHSDLDAELAALLDAHEHERRDVPPQEEA